MSNIITASLGSYADFFAALGFLMTAWILVKFILGLLGGVRAYLLGPGVDLKRMGPWAVVTGATDGIGKAYAQELASQGLDIVLISRNPEKLGDVAKEIESKHNVKTRCVAVDFSSGPEIYHKIQQEIGNLEIGVLVNNVGISYAFPEFFTKIGDEKKMRDLVTINVNSVAEMTRIVLPGMEERRRGVIINLSSASGLRPTPLLTIYSAAKAFVDTFTHALDVEVKKKGIIVQSVVPFYVATRMSGIRRTSFFVPSPAAFAKSALGTVGLVTRSFGCLSHALQGYVVSSLPEVLYNFATVQKMLSVRARTLKKQQKSQ